ncbi:glutathione S-transferase D7-like [Dermacentor variabilis]|uniref:glutathione S-transferase D7-like n=1 Tax=Dermacentor variabilis TaxID=34621 RepID=UPI003F5B0741
MSIVLYQLNASPPCRAVRIVARLVGIVLELKDVNVLAKEQMEDYFLKLNPMHTIPTLQDDNFVLWESRAIMRYLVDMYAPDHSLYPKDVRKRALIDQFLDYDLGTFYRTVADYFYSYLLKGEPKCEKKEEAFRSSLRSMEHLLGDKPRRFLTGSQMTLADVALMESLTVPETMDYDLSSFPSVKAWYDWMQSKLCTVNEVNVEGIAQFRACIGMQ